MISRFFRALALLAILSVAAPTALEARATGPTSLRLPLQFGPQFQDDPQRASAIAMPAAGSPGVGPDGLICYRSRRTLAVVDHGRFQVQDLDKMVLEAVTKGGLGEQWDHYWDETPGVDSRVVIDDDDRAYTILTPTPGRYRHGVLLYSSDRCRSWTAYELPGLTGSIEARDGYNSHRGATVVSSDNYRSVNGTRLWLQRFEAGADGALRPALPARLITDSSLTPPNHSGGANITYTRDRSIFITYPLSTPPLGGHPGTDTVIQRLDLDSGVLSPPVFLGVAGDLSPSKIISQDDHDTPAITGDQSGVLTVLLGAHHGLFKLTQSRSPMAIDRGWTIPEPIGRRNVDTFTYISLLTDNEQTLQVFARREGDFADYHFQLVQMRKPHGAPFELWGDKIYRVIVEPGRAFYAAWRQRLTLAPDGRLFLHFIYSPNDLTPEEEAILPHHPIHDAPTVCERGRCFMHLEVDLFPTVLVSYDRGQTFSVFAAELGQTAP
jgi:hypothetical protein